MSVKRGAIIAATVTALLSLALPAHAQEPPGPQTAPATGMPVSSQMCQAGGGAVSAAGGMGSCSGGAYGGKVVIIIVGGGPGV